MGRPSQSYPRPTVTANSETELHNAFCQAANDLAEAVQCVLARETTTPVPSREFSLFVDGRIMYYAVNRTSVTVRIRYDEIMIASTLPVGTKQVIDLWDGECEIIPWTITIELVVGSSGQRRSWIDVS